ncbi:MAG: hypothetical protein M4579_003101 [Chaenotheca gracillima]|nr:MAG: hypothetical protein M4579_003101 [Chaenotheca gracillima]
MQGRRQFDPKGASEICRRKVWEAVAATVSLLGRPDTLSNVKTVSANEEQISGRRQQDPFEGTYKDLKEQNQQLAARREVKSSVRSASLKNWTRNSGDDLFHLQGA